MTKTTKTGGHWVVRMNYRNRTASWVMVFGVMGSHFAGQSYGSMAWVLWPAVWSPPGSARFAGTAGAELATRLDARPALDWRWAFRCGSPSRYFRLHQLGHSGVPRLQATDSWWRVLCRGGWRWQYQPGTSTLTIFGLRATC
jgi:hypothetical protein